MKAIRPIYDGKDDLDYRDNIDCVDMMVCLFSQINEEIDDMEYINEPERKHLKLMADVEIMPWNDSATDNGIYDLMIMFEIVRWLKECGYEWNAVASARYKHIAKILGIIYENNGQSMYSSETKEYVLNVEGRAFRDLKMLLPLHWATILLDWYPVMIDGMDNEKIIEFGNIMITYYEAEKGE